MKAKLALRASASLTGATFAAHESFDAAVQRVKTKLDAAGCDDLTP